MGDSLEVDGKATVKLMYLDAAGTDLQYYENSRPFTASIPLGKSVENATSTVTTRVEYINCRATSPRHLDVDFHQIELGGQERFRPRADG